jgi:3-phosphoshikimate 1-carboxyvinyltransferase
MGAGVETWRGGDAGGEPVGSIRVRPGELRGIVVEEEEVPALIDEIPLVAVLALFAAGQTTVRGAGELRHKESDRLEAVARLAAAVSGAARADRGRLHRRGQGGRRAGARTGAGGCAGGSSSWPWRGPRSAAGIDGGLTVDGMEAAAVSFPDFIRRSPGAGG